jgi:hypothetical protein
LKILWVMDLKIDGQLHIRILVIGAYDEIGMESDEITKIKRMPFEGSSEAIF